MSMSTLYRHAAAPSARATPEDAKMLSRLATKAQELASEHGVVLTRKEALQRARGNLAFVKAMYGAKEIQP